MITPSYYPVKNGLLRGAKCPLSGVLFVSQNPSELEGLISQSLAHTAAIMLDQDNGVIRWRSLESRRNLFNQT